MPSQPAKPPPKNSHWQLFAAFNPLEQQQNQAGGGTMGRRMEGSK
jgi:hypothetical protein